MARKRAQPQAAAPPQNPGTELATQPVRVAPGQEYGQRQAQEGQQQGAPLPVATGGGVSPGPPSAAAPPGPMPPDMSGLFAPSQMPGPGGPLPPQAQNQFVPQDPDMLLKAIYQAFPHPEIARLMRALR